MDKKAFMGKNLLNKLELFSFFFIYTVIILVFILGTITGMGSDVLIYSGIGVVFYIIVFVAVKQYVLRIMGEKWAGVTVIEGWLDEENGVGSFLSLIIEDATPYERFSPVNKEKIDEYMKLIIRPRLGEFESEEVTRVKRETLAIKGVMEA